MLKRSHSLPHLAACVPLVLLAVGLTSVAAAAPLSWQAAVEAYRAARPNILPAEDAAGGNDGVMQPNGWGFHTGQDQSPWWQVDLQAEEPLDHVIIYAPHMPERLNGFQVKLSPDGQVWHVAFTQEKDTTGTPQLTVPLGGERARFVRIEVPASTWMHLAEVEVFGTADPATNLALHKPADQSSVSQWSNRWIVLGEGAGEWRADTNAGQRVIANLAGHAGPLRVDLQRRATALADAGTALDDPAWAALYEEARAGRAEWSDVETQWPLVNLDALGRALADLAARFPERYGQAEEYRQHLAAYRGQVEGLGPRLDAGDADAWRLAQEIVKFQREVLLANPLLDFDRLLVIHRRLGESARAVMGDGLGVGSANWTTNDTLPRTGWDTEIAVLSGLRGTPELQTLYRPDGGKIVLDLDLDFDASRILFSSVGDAEPNWRLFEIGSDGTGLRQVTPDDGADIGHFDACYLPGGDVIFASTATYQGLPCVYGSSQMVSLYRLHRATGRARQLTFEQDSDWCPTVLPDGRVLYQRWEYADLPHSSSRLLFRMNPDGTEQQEFTGSGSYFTPSFFYARPVPGHPTEVIGVAGGHHGTPRSGRLLIMDPALGHHEAEGVVQEIPGWGKKVEPIVRDRLADGAWPQFLNPWPLSEQYHLVAMKPSADALWGIYLVDVFDNLTLLYQAEDSGFIEPIPFVPRSTPPVLSDRVEAGRTDASVFLADIYSGPGLAGIPRGTVKRLRVGTYYFSSRGVGGLLGCIGMDGPWDVKRVLGTVPVEEDGSAAFTIPANTPIFVQPLDDEGKALQLMRSWFTGMPGEVVSCTGCHENRGTTVGAKASLAADRPLSTIEPWHGPVHGFSFPDDVQPVLDRYCVGCHDGSASAAPDLRGTQYITDWSSQISGNCGPSQGGNFSVSYANLHRYVRRPGIESDLHMLTPGEFHADTTELVQLLRGGRHHNVRLDQDGWESLITWIDLNAPFHGTWSTVAPVAKTNVAAVNARRIELSTRYAGISTDFEATPYRAPAGPITPLMPEVLPSAAPPVACEGWPFGPEEAQRRQAALGDATLTVDLGQGLQMKLAHIPAGQYVTGGAGARVVQVERPFWMGQCEVTNEQFRRFDPAHDSRHEDRHGYQFGRVGYPMTTPQAPVVRVNWNEAMAFCAWLSEQTGRRFTLPAEEQWEWSCRAGADTPFWFGPADADYTPYANLGDLRLKEFAACTAQNNYSECAVISNPSPYDDWVPHDTRFDDGTFLTADVGHYQPNPWGLYDMHGNVGEWTSSERSAGRKVVRGGSFYVRPQRCTADSWLDYRPYQKVFDVGFRVICDD